MQNELWTVSPAWFHGRSEIDMLFQPASRFRWTGHLCQKLVREFEDQNIHTTFRQLRSAQAALLFSVSWGDWFHRLCRRWGVRTVLRVDGFLVPSYFDNRPQPEGYQDRRLKLSDMAQNYRLQRDLFLSDFVVYQSAFSKQMADEFLYNRRGISPSSTMALTCSAFIPARRAAGAGDCCRQDRYGTSIC